jgi:hypothetical protein
LVIVKRGYQNCEHFKSAVGKFLSFICPLFVIVLFFAKAKNKTKNLLLKGSNKADFDINLISKI